jgi:hypothetical protein
MPLIKQTLEYKLKSRILLLEPKLYAALQKRTTGLYKAQFLVDQKISEAAPASGFGVAKYKDKLWKTNAKEWGKVLAKEIIKIIAEDVSDIISDEITTYIKSATITTLPGTPVQVVPATGTGTTVAPTTPAKII